MLQPSASPKATVTTRIKESIQRVSVNGAFQRKLMVFFLIVSFFMNFQLYSSNIFFMNPSFECENFDYKVSEDQACKMMDFCKLTNQQTIVAELNLYCDQGRDQRTLLQTLVGVGKWIGIFFSGTLSDRKGRKLCFCIGLLLFNVTTVFQIVGVYFQSISMLLVSQVVAGFSNKVIHLNVLVILTRFLRKEQCEIGTLGWFIVGNGLGVIAVAGANQLFHSWRIHMYIQFIGLFTCSIASVFILKEDPIYLFDTGKLNQSKRVLQSIGEQNGADFKTNQQNMRKIDEIFEMKMRSIQTNPNGVQNKFDCSELLRCDILTNIAIIGIAGCLYNMAVKSIELSLNTLKYSYNFNLFITGLANICAFVSAIYITRVEIQKKKGFIVVSFIYGILAMLLIFPFFHQNGGVQTLLIFFLKLLIDWICNFYTRLKVDNFPQKYQMVCMGVVQAITNTGTVLGPALIQKASDSHMNPIFAVNLFRMTIGTLPLFFLSEKKVELNYEHQSLVKNDKVKAISE